METTISIPRIKHETESAFMERVRHKVSEKGCRLICIIHSDLAISKGKTPSSVNYLSDIIEVRVDMDCR